MEICTLHYINIRCASKSWRIASLICCMEPNKKSVMKKLKTKDQDAQKKQSAGKVRGVSPEAARESTCMCIYNTDFQLQISKFKKIPTVVVLYVYLSHR